MTGYTGSLCDSEIDECQSNPCQNGAKCEDRLGAYVCHCLSEYRGDNCEKRRYLLLKHSLYPNVA